MKRLLIILIVFVAFLMGCQQDSEEPATLVRKWKMLKIEQGDQVVTEGLGFFELDLKADNTYDRTDVDGLMTFGRWEENSGYLSLINDLLLKETEFEILALNSREMTLFFEPSNIDQNKGARETTYYMERKE